MRHCEYCGKPLSADAAPRKRFCSAECERRSYYEGRRDKDHAREEAEEGIPLREFQCEYCGHWVRVMSKSDKRFRFCSAKCEKAFWKRNKPKAAGAAKAPAGRGFGGGYFERCCKWCRKKATRFTSTIRRGMTISADTKTRSMKKSRCRTWYSRGFIATQRI